MAAVPVAAAPPVSALPEPPARAERFPTDFSRSPFIVIWEVTRACALACLHCRADAIARRDPRELSTEEGFRLIDQVAAFGDPSPLFVLTGGDPMWRKDLARLVEYASAAGLRVALTPSGTAAATRQRLAELKDAGLSRIAVSVDGPDAGTHDGFRRVRGSHTYTMRIIDAAIGLGLPLQINSTVSRLTLPGLRALAERLTELPLALWAVFFLIQTGRGASLDQVTADECEAVLRWLHELSGRVPFGIKTTEAPHFRRVAWESERRAGWSPGAGPAARATLRAARGVNDGNGFVFVDHVGEICPSGFLPMPRGNVRDAVLVETYRHDRLFVDLRRADALADRCGRCRFREICGGSRSRAFAATGDPFGADPLCPYDPGPAVEPAIVA